MNLITRVFSSLCLILTSNLILAQNISWSVDDYQAYDVDINGDGLTDLFLHAKHSTNESKLIMGMDENGRLAFLVENEHLLPSLLWWALMERRTSSCSAGRFFG